MLCKYFLIKLQMLKDADAVRKLLTVILPANTLFSKKYTTKEIFNHKDQQHSQRLQKKSKRIGVLGITKL